MKWKSIIFFGLFLLSFIGGMLYFNSLNPAMCGRGSGKEQAIDAGSNFLPNYRISYKCWGKMEHVAGIILHYTGTHDVESAIQAMEERELFVQLIIDKDGSVYQLTDNIDDFSAGATGGNAWGINIEIVGDHFSLMRSAIIKDAQFRSVVDTVKYVSQKFDILISNDIPAENILIWSGIYSHEQVDKYHPKGGRNNKIDPGKEYMNAVMNTLREEDI